MSQDDMMQEMNVLVAQLRDTRRILANLDQPVSGMSDEEQAMALLCVEKAVEILSSFELTYEAADANDPVILTKTPELEGTKN